MSGVVSTTTSVALIDLRTRSYQLTLPLTTSVPYRVLYIKDMYGSASAARTITLVTQGSDTFEDLTTSKVFTNPYEVSAVIAGQPGKWFIIGGTTNYKQAMQSISSGNLFLSSINFIDTANNISQLLAVTNNSLQLNGNVFANIANLNSTLQGLGTFGFLSTVQPSLNSTVQGLGTSG